MLAELQLDNMICFDVSLRARAKTVGPPRDPRKNIIVGLMPKGALRPTAQQLKKASWPDLRWLDHYGHGGLFDDWKVRHPNVDVAQMRKFANPPVVCVPGALGRCCARMRL